MAKRGSISAQTQPTHGQLERPEVASPGAPQPPTANTSPYEYDSTPMPTGSNTASTVSTMDSVGTAGTMDGMSTMSSTATTYERTAFQQDLGNRPVHQDSINGIVHQDLGNRPGHPDLSNRNAPQPYETPNTPPARAAPTITAAVATVVHGHEVADYVTMVESAKTAPVLYETDVVQAPSAIQPVTFAKKAEHGHATTAITPSNTPATTSSASTNRGRGTGSSLDDNGHTAAIETAPVYIRHKLYHCPSFSKWCWANTS